MKPLYTTLWITGTLMLLARAAHAEDEATTFSTTETKTEVVYGPAGLEPCLFGSGSGQVSGQGACWFEQTSEVTLPYVLIDSTDGKTTFPVEEKMRSFADEKEFLSFVQKALNAKPVYDKSGELVGVEGETLELGKPSISDGVKEQVELVADPIAAFLGGKSNAFTIGDQVYTLPSQEEIVALTEYGDPMTTANNTFPSSGQKCNNAQTDCIKGESFNTHAGIYHSVGSSTKQTVGGYREWSAFCWKGPIPWVCTKHSGSNRLYAASAIFYPSYNGSPAFLSSQTVNKANTTEVTARVWQVGVTGLVAKANGACGSHSSESISGVLVTGSGRYDPNGCGSSY